MTYEMDIAGLKRDLPICPVNENLSIGAFVMFGDVELTVHCAAKLLDIFRSSGIGRDDQYIIRGTQYDLFKFPSFGNRMV